MMNYTQKIGGETILTIGFLFSGLYILVESYNYPNEVAIFPRFVSVIMIMCSILVVSEKYMPTPLQTLISKDDTKLVDIEDKLDEDIGEETQVAETDERVRIEIFSLKIDKGLITGASCLCYILLSYLIGIYYATPIFAMSYMYITGKSWYTIIGLGIIGYTISHLFMVLLNVQLINGVLMP